MVMMLTFVYIHLANKVAIYMKIRILSIVLMLLLIVTISTGICYGADNFTVSDTLKSANEFMNDYFGYTLGDKVYSKYYKVTSPSGKELNEEYACGSKAFNGYPVIVYGEAKDAAKDATKYGADDVEIRKKEYREIGRAHV